jgi:hypothetical protein
MGWTTHTLTFVADDLSSTILFVSDVSASGGTLNAGAALDNVRIGPPSPAATAVPVPLGWTPWLAVLAIAFAAGMTFRMRKRNG